MRMWGAPDRKPFVGALPGQRAREPDLRMATEVIDRGDSTAEAPAWCWRDTEGESRLSDHALHDS